MKRIFFISNKRFSLFLLLASAVLFLITSITAPRIDGIFGLFRYVKSLPLYYWPGILFAITALYKGRNSNWLVAADIFILSGYLFGLPSIIFVNSPCLVDFWAHLSDAAYLSKTGDFALATAEYPGSYIFMSILNKVSQAGFIHIGEFFPYLYASFLGLIVYGVSLKITTRKVAWISPLALLSFLWYYGHFCKQVYGLMLWGFFFLLFIAHLKNRDRRFLLISIMAFGGLTISHPLSSLLALGVVGTYLLFQIIFLDNGEMSLPSHFFLLPFAVWVSWYIIPNFITKTIVATLTRTWNIIFMGKPIITHLGEQFGRYTSIYQSILKMRIFSSLLCIFIGSVASVVILLKRRKRICIMLAAGLIMLIGFFVFPWSLTDIRTNIVRAPLHMIIFSAVSLPVALKIVQKIRSRLSTFLKILACLFLASLILLMPIVKYSPRVNSYIPTSSSEEAKFLANHVSSNVSRYTKSDSVGLRLYSVLKSNFYLVNLSHRPKQRKSGRSVIFRTVASPKYSFTLEDYDLLIFSSRYRSENMIRTFPYSAILENIRKSITARRGFNRVYSATDATFLLLN